MNQNRAGGEITDPLPNCKTLLVTKTTLMAKKRER